jgi:hypothetical protein
LKCIELIFYPSDAFEDMLPQGLVQLEALSISKSRLDPTAFLHPKLYQRLPNLTHLFLCADSTVINASCLARIEVLAAHAALQHVYFLLDTCKYADDHGDIWESNAAFNNKNLQPWCTLALLMQASAASVSSLRVHLCIRAEPQDEAEQSKLAELATTMRMPQGLLSHERSLEEDHGFWPCWETQWRRAGGLRPR